jgi:hypothetical protein
MIGVLRAGVVYFTVVFGVGFFLGMIRVPLLVPRLGQLIAELIELPFLIVAIFLTARWIVRRFDLHGQPLRAILTGTVAAIFLLLMEFSVILWVRGLTLSEFLAARDPVAATFYYIAVAIFAVMPAIISFRSSKNE